MSDSITNNIKELKNVDLKNLVLTAILIAVTFYLSKDYTEIKENKVLFMIFIAIILNIFFKIITKVFNFIKTKFFKQENNETSAFINNTNNAITHKRLDLNKGILSKLDKKNKNIQKSLNYIKNNYNSKNIRFLEKLIETEKTNNIKYQYKILVEVSYSRDRKFLNEQQKLKRLENLKDLSYKNPIDISPNMKAKFFLNTASSLHKLKKYEEAYNVCIAMLKQLKKVKRVYPDDIAQALIFCSIYHYENKDFDQALQKLNESYKYSKDKYYITFLISIIYMEGFLDFHKTIKELNKIKNYINDNTHFYTGFCNISSICYALLKEYNTSKEYLEKITKKQDSNSDKDITLLESNLAYIYCKLKKYPKAKSLAEKIITKKVAKNKKYVAINCMSIINLYKNKKYSDALNGFLSIEKQYIKDFENKKNSEYFLSELYYNIFKCQLELNNIEEARIYYNLAKQYSFDEFKEQDKAELHKKELGDYSTVNKSIVSNILNKLKIT